MRLQSKTPQMKTGLGGEKRPCSPFTMLRISARTGPLEGASGMYMVYSPMFRLTGFSLRSGWYTSRSFSVMIPPGTSRGFRWALCYCIIITERRDGDLQPGCPPPCSEPWSLCRTRRDPPRRFSGTYRPTLGIGQCRFPSGCSSESRRTPSWRETEKMPQMKPRKSTVIVRIQLSRSL